MNLPKAIRLLHKYRHIDDNLCIEDVNESLELGMAAMEAVISQRRECPLSPIKPLKGETDE